MPEDLATFLATLAAPRHAPAGITAAAAGLAMGLALLERALAHPPEDAVPGTAEAIRELLAATRKRTLDIVAADLAASEALAVAFESTDPEADAIQAGARVPAYRAARRLIDLSIQALNQVKPVIDAGNRSALADVETAWRLMAVALEAGIAACEQHLPGLSSFFADAERPALIEQAQQGREWTERAHGALSWRLGRE